MERLKLLELGNPLSRGLLADRILEIFVSGKALSSDDRQVLSNLEKFLKHAEDGSRQVRTGNLSEGAIDSISAYRTVMSIPPRALDKQRQDEIEKLVDDVTKEISLVLQNGKVASNDSQNLKAFARALRKVSINVVGMSLGREEKLPWPRTTTH